MEHHRSVPWWQAVLDTCIYESVSGFVEYEAYGNYELELRRAGWPAVGGATRSRRGCS